MTNSYLGLEKIPFGASSVAVTAYRLSQLLRSELEGALAVQGELSLIEWRICLGLSEASTVSQKELVQFTRMQQAQVSRALVLLEERSLIVSTSSKQDRRSKLYSLTELGSKYLKRNLPIVLEFCETIDAALSPPEIELYMQLSERIARVAIENAKQTDGQNNAATASM